MSKELKNELKIELSCNECSFTKVITIGLDEDGVFTIPNKFCPHDLGELERDVLRQFVSAEEELTQADALEVAEATLKDLSEPKPNDSTEDKTEPTNTVPKSARPVGLPKNRTNSSKKS